MKILALEKEVPGIADGQYEPHLREEARRVWDLHQAGVIREMYFQADHSRAVLILECTDCRDAATVLDSLPLVRQGLIAFELIPLVAYPGFERLFGPGET